MKTVEGYQPKEEFSKKALIDRTKYHEMYKRSVESPEAFWEEQGRNRCLLYTSPSPRDSTLSRMPSSA